MEWNDPANVALVTGCFARWAKAVISKDRATVEAIHEDGFRVRLGDRLLTKDEHILLELAVTNTEMETLSIDTVRSVGDLLLVRSTRRMKIEEAPEIPSLGLFGDWADIAKIRNGFIQGEFSVWRRESDSLRCIAFDIGSFKVSAG